MENWKKWWAPGLVVLAAFLITLIPASRASAQEGPVLVGRISYVEGQLLRYVPETKNWVLVRENSPFGLSDALYSGDSSKAEFIFPNGLLVRIAAGTQIQLIALKDDASEMDLESGIARFYNRNPNGMLKVTTPYGYVLAQPNSIFDVYLGDSSVEVIALNGRVDYIQQSDNSSYELTPGGESIIADASQVSSGQDAVDAGWDAWNSRRDDLLARRMKEVRDTESYRYLPPQLDTYAYDLHRSGRWERVYYEGEYREFWRPTDVSDNWQPFTDGRWTDYYGDQVWVPNERFGYVTCHYGNWVHVGGGWYWAPPVPLGAPPSGPDIAFSWYPGRVAWIGTGENIGWVPLAPNEPYYAHHYWGPAAVIASAAVAPFAIASLAYAASAVIVPHRDFYSVENYNRVRVTNINKTVIINNYHAAPVVNNTILKNYDRTPARFNFVNKAPTAIPYHAVDKKIIHNNQIARTTAAKLSAPALRHAVAAAKPAKPMARGTVHPPTKLTSKLVSPKQANAPQTQVKFKTLSIKKQTRPAKSSPAARPGAAKAPVHAAAPPAAHPALPKPGVQPPATHPALPPGVHPPATHPGQQKPGMRPPVQHPTFPQGMNRPEARPAPPKPGVHPPATHPALPPGIHPPATHPGQQKPGVRPPVQRPAIPQGMNRPAARPAPPKPGVHPPAARPAPQRPAARPAPQRPAYHPPAARPAPQRPAYHPPAARPAPQRPAARPAPPRPAPHPPAARPAPHKPAPQEKNKHPQ
ncbi:MAG: DUF6600 domain-containing protein [Syntrophobacteraceae bacterium]